MKLTTASLSFNLQGTPTSDEFDDVYFSNQNGFEESKYVFFDHNLLNDRFFSHKSNHFVIGETGFGTGLNFLLTAHFFMEYLAQKGPEQKLQRLYFVSTEKFPIPHEDLKKSLAQWTLLQELSEHLLVQYPTFTPGCHRMSFAEGQIILDLWLGDAAEVFDGIHIYPKGIVDAWYLDGFAPSKNPDMWQPRLFSQMARLSRNNATLATFTAAGIVKRGLKQNGFVLKKVKGFGKKRDMLTGYFAPEEAKAKYVEVQQPSTSPKVFAHRNTEKKLQGPWQRLPSTHQVTSKTGPTVAIIGAGLAGANIALSLARKGYKCHIYCSERDIAMGASGNHIGGFYPSLNADFSLQSQLYSHAFSYARRHYDQLHSQGYQFAYDWCGVFFPAFSDEVSRRQAKLIENDIWPENLVHSLNSKEATQICNVSMPYSGLYIPNGGWISPSQCVTATISAAMELGCQLQVYQKLKSMKQATSDNSWQLTWHDDRYSYYDLVVFATGSGSVNQAFLANIPFTRSRGQVEYLPQLPTSACPATVICHKGYFTPFNNGKQAMGATFDKHNIHDEVQEQDSAKNRSTIEKALTECDWVTALPDPTERRAAIRCSLPDHRPVMGAVPDISQQKEQYRELYKALPLSSYPLPASYSGLHVLTGLGSHGLCTSPLLAEALACQISGEPLPLNSDLLASISPNRFLIRELIRGKI